jgi:hypothetical protein
MQCNYLRLFSSGDNIFVNSTGEWFLGDFGSCRRRDDVIRLTTEVFFYESLRGKKAEPNICFLCFWLLSLLKPFPISKFFQGINRRRPCQQMSAGFKNPSN